MSSPTPPPDHPVGLDTESNDIFEYVRKPRRYFRVGRVFATRWAEPWSEYKDASKNASSRLSPKSRVFEETRRFVVVQESHGASLCVPIHTYGGRGPEKGHIKLEDHARVYRDKTNPPEKEPRMKEPIGVVVEPDSQLPQLHPQSIANFGKIYTVEHGVQIANIGFVHKSQKHRLQVSWKSSTVDKVSTGSKIPNNSRDVDDSHNPGLITCDCNTGRELDHTDNGSQASHASDLKTAADSQRKPQKSPPGVSLNKPAMASLGDGNTGAQNLSSDTTSLSSRNVENGLHDSDAQEGLAADAIIRHFLLDNRDAGVDILNQINAVKADIIDRLRDLRARIEAHSRVPSSDLQTASAKGPGNIMDFLIVEEPDIDTPHSRVSGNGPQAAPLADKPTVPLPCDKSVNANERSTSPHDEQRPRLAGCAKRKNTDTMRSPTQSPRSTPTTEPPNKRQKHNNAQPPRLGPA